MTTSDYPLPSSLRQIRRWSFQDIPGCFAYLHSLWKYADVGFWRETQRSYYISTAGWSGNEALIDALNDNGMIWSICWFSTTRGGHYVFRKQKIATTKGEPQ